MARIAEIKVSQIDWKVSLTILLYLGQEWVEHRCVFQDIRLHLALQMKTKKPGHCLSVYGVRD